MSKLYINALGFTSDGAAFIPRWNKQNYNAPMSNFISAITSSTGAIYVPKELYSMYITAYGWSTYSASMIPCDLGYEKVTLPIDENGAMYFDNKIQYFTLEKGLYYAKVDVSTPAEDTQYYIRPSEVWKPLSGYKIIELPNGFEIGETYYTLNDGLYSQVLTGAYDSSITYYVRTYGTQVLNEVEL